MKTISIKTRIIVPAAAVLITLFISFLVGVWFLLSESLENDCTNDLSSSKRFFNKEIEEDIEVLTAVTDVLARDEMLKQLWTEHNREAITQYASPILSNLQISYEIAHLYFIEPNQTTFLRVHQPDLYGDLIDRFTIRQAVKNQKVTAGLEFGPLGTYSLRLVRPWYIENRLAGYIEVSKDISNITRKMHEIIGVDLVVLIKEKIPGQSGIGQWKGYFLAQIMLGYPAE